MLFLVDMFIIALIHFETISSHICTVFGVEGCIRSEGEHVNAVVCICISVSMSIELELKMLFPGLGG